MSLEGLQAMRDVTAPIRGTSTAVRVRWDDFANLIAIAEAADEVVNSHIETICRHGNVDWNCESCDFDRQEKLRKAVDLLQEDQGS